MNPFKTLVFDWSGTLVDDLTGVVRATNAVFKAFGAPMITRAEFLERFRLPYAGFYEEYLPGVALEEIEEVFRTVFRAAHNEVFLLDHAHSILRWGQQKNLSLLVLSSMDEVALLQQAERFNLRPFFQEIHAGVADKRTVGHDLVARYGHQGEIAFFGDMVHDIDTARDTGMTSIALLTGYDHKERLAKAKPDYLLPDLSSFMALFSS